MDQGGTRTVLSREDLVNLGWKIEELEGVFTKEETEFVCGMVHWAGRITGPARKEDGVELLT